MRSEAVQGLTTALRYFRLYLPNTVQGSEIRLPEHHEAYLQERTGYGYRKSILARWQTHLLTLLMLYRSFQMTLPLYSRNL